MIFTLVTITCASLRPDYHYTQFISELGAADSPNALLMNFAGFMLAGIMIIAFGIALVLDSKGIVARIGSILITLFGCGMFIAGIFSCDVGCPREGTLENTIHDQVSGPAFLSAILGIFLKGISFRRLPAWNGLWAYSLVSAIISAGFMIALVDSIEAYTTTGLWQRLLLTALFIWCAIVGWKMYKSPHSLEEHKR